MHDQGKLLVLALTWENGYAGVQFHENAAETPHVDARSVRNAEDNLWRPVEARLDIGVDPLV